MELSQVVRRILMQHWRLIAVCVLIPVAAVTAIESRHTSTYTANARLALDTPDPTNRNEAAAIGDTVQGLATSPDRVAYALKQAKVTGRDPDTVAKHNVTVSNLGSSGLVQLSVTDRDPRVAAAIANALARAVIQKRIDLTSGVSQGALTDLATGIGNLQRKITATDTAIAALNAQLAGSQSGTNSQLIAQRDTLTQTRAALDAEQNVLQSERAGVVTAFSAKPRAEVVSAAAPPSKADSSKLPVMIVLAILLGLVGGIAVAAVIETVRPTVVGSAAVAQEFDAPLLGTLRSTPEDEVALADLGSLPTRFALAVRPAVVPSVGLVGASPSVDLRPLAARLDSQEQSPSLRAGTRFVMAQHGEPPATTTAVAAEPKEHGSAAVRVFAAAPGSAPGLNGHGIGGVVVVAPSLLRTAEIEETHHLLRIMPAPLLGIVTYPRAERRRNRRARFGR